MKNNFIARARAIGLTTLSLIAITFVATAAATTTFYPIMYVDKKGLFFTFTIDTTGKFIGSEVDPSSIVVTVYDVKSNAIVIYPDLSSIALTANSVVIRIIRLDLPHRASACNVIGDVGTAGDTFFAAGPGWAFGNVH